MTSLDNVPEKTQADFVQKYRIPALPLIVDQACFYCHKYLHPSDGLPYQRTGLLPPAQTKQTNGTGKTDGGTEPRYIDQGHDNGQEQQDGAYWICWHASCDPYP